MLKFEPPHHLSRRRIFISRGIVALLTIVFSFAAGEIVLRLGRDTDQFLPYHQNSTRIIYPSEEITPGVNGVSYFTTNSFGTRGPEPGAESIRILTIGGSTTACDILDDTETWPSLLMDYINQDADDEHYAWVTNSGKSGMNSQHHILHARYLVPRIPDLDYVILYAGINDAGMWMWQEEFDPDYLNDPKNWSRRMGEAFRISSYIPVDYPIYKRLELWRRASIAKDRILSSRNERSRGVIVQDASLEWIKAEQQRRRVAAKLIVPRGKMETLIVVLNSYRRNLTTFVKLVREAGAEPIFIAQAVQREFRTEEERQRLWFGEVNGGKGYADHEQLVAIVGRFNEQMRDVAQAEDVLFLDLPRHLQDDWRHYYDGVHVNEFGARSVARVVATILQEEILVHAK